MKRLPLQFMKRDLIYADSVIYFWKLHVRLVDAMWNSGQQSSTADVLKRSGDFIFLKFLFWKNQKN